MQRLFKEESFKQRFGYLLKSLNTNSTNNISCESLMYETQYIVKKGNPYKFTLIYIFSLIHGIIPIIARVMNGLPPFGCSTTDHIFFVLTFI